MKATANSKKIKELREKRGWSQDQLAEMSRISLRTIQRVEKDGNCFIETIKAIASVFELDFKELLEEDFSKKFADIEFLTRIEYGKQIADIISGKHAYDLDFETSIVDPQLLELMHSFFQELQDYGELWDEIEYSGRGQGILSFQNWVDELAKNDLWVFGGKAKRPIGQYNPPLIFDILVIRIYTKDSASIIKVDIGNPYISKAI